MSWLPRGFLQAEREYLDPDLYDIPHFCHGEYDSLDYDPDEIYEDEEFEDVD